MRLVHLMTKTATDGHDASAQLASKRELFRLAMTERSDPDPFYEKLAARTIAELDVDPAGARVLDLGCGTGHNSAALRAAGAEVVALDLDPALAAMSHAKHDGLPATAGDATALPFADGAFDGLFCSNVLEHVPSVPLMLDEVARVLRPGGWAWISWTNWWSPWGGHNITPLHLLGPSLGPKVWNRLFGVPPKNVPGEGLFPTYVGETLERIDAMSDLTMLDARPRYYPSQRWILRVPGFREVATWNCAMTLERT